MIAQAIGMLLFSALSLIFTAIYIRTKGSVLLAVLLHAGSNVSSNIIYYIFPTVEAVAPHRLIIYTIYVILMSIIGFIMLKKR
ncbi:MAG: hypothetical protein IH949_10300 [Bacteroidetes bacterium]|nr:hypothetical protein [Bacteroidota bacterium]